jgi:hypothetical protein
MDPVNPRQRRQAYVHGKFGDVRFGVLVVRKHFSKSVTLRDLSRSLTDRFYQV